MRARLMTLESRKKELEKELTDIYEFLSTPTATCPKPPGVKGPLVDEEGFPRNDIDVHAVRTLRHKRALLQTDYSKLMKEIEDGLHRIHQLPRRIQSEDDDVSTKTRTKPSTTTTRKAIPFAIVKSVVEGSPSFMAGLKANDRIVQFGSADSTNHRNLQLVGETVRDRVGQSISVGVLREGNKEVITLNLTPRRWHGTGLLGCHIIPSN